MDAKRETAIWNVRIVLGDYGVNLHYGSYAECVAYIAGEPTLTVASENDGLQVIYVRRVE